jgi:hypothetical protein
MVSAVYCCWLHSCCCSDRMLLLHGRCCPAVVTLCVAALAVPAVHLLVCCCIPPCCCTDFLQVLYCQYLLCISILLLGYSTWFARARQHTLPGHPPAAALGPNLLTWLPPAAALAALGRVTASIKSCCPHP